MQALALNPLRVSRLDGLLLYDRSIYANNWRVAIP